jgi:aminoglycoside/choline kinase family phosphotransferase
MLPERLPPDPRLDGFLAGAGWAGAERRLLAADASFRHYQRIGLAGNTAVLMVAPPDKEPVAPFLAVQRRLRAMQLSAPRLLAADEAAGLLLLEDLGDRTFTRALAAGVDERQLYSLGIDVLVALHERWRPEERSGLPPYDEAALLKEALLLVDWYLPAASGRATPTAVRETFVAAWREVLAQVARRRDTLVLRDYHVDNLMLLAGRSGIAGCGLLDFQDALLGAPAYDLVSLLEDARRDIAPDLAQAMLARYLAARPGVDRDSLLNDYAVLGLQRSTKIVGIFTRLDRRDGKPVYLRHLPRLWHLIGRGLEHPRLAPVKSWFDREVPPELRVQLESSPGGGVPS